MLTPKANLRHVIALLLMLGAGTSAASAAGMGMQMPMKMTGGVEMTQTVGPYRYVLDLLPAEPFYTKAQYQSEHPKDGMLVERGAQPIAPDSSTHPNHHLIVHVFDAATGKAVLDGNVSIRYTGLSGPLKGVTASLAVVEMQAIGKGPQSTHYGNNLALPAGTYRVRVSANGGAPAVFTLTAT